MIGDLRENMWVNNMFVEIIRFVRADGVMTKHGKRVVYIYVIRDDTGECFMKVWLYNPRAYLEEILRERQKIYIIKGYINEYTNDFYVNVNGVDNIKIVV